MKPPARRPRPARIAALAAAALLLAAVPRGRADVTSPVLAQTFNYAPGGVAMAPYMTQTGWDISSIVFSYNTSTDVLTVDMKTTGIAGDADGLGLMGKPDPQLAAYGGYNPANLGGRDSISVAFTAANANQSLGVPLVIAGVPEYKAANAPNDGFQVATYTGNPSLQVGYGMPISGITGSLLNGGPSAQYPDFEFTIGNFSKIPGLNIYNGFYFSAYAGSPDDVVAGEDLVSGTYVGALRPAAQTVTSTTPGNPLRPPSPSIASGSPQIDQPTIPTLPGLPAIVPEPSSFALVGVGAVGLGVAAIRRRRSAKA